jgi:hypothetical protein
MRVLVGILLLIIIAGGAVSALLVYKYLHQGRRIIALEKEIDARDKLVSSVNQSFNRQILFIHHSVGDQWLNEGELRAELWRRGFGVHDATYGDEIGEYTDMCDWVGKFSNQMDRILKFDYHSNAYYDGPIENDIIMFKSCFPNNQIVGEGNPPGDPNDKTKLIWNYKAAMQTLKGIFSRYPGKTFIYVTSPPLVPQATNPEQAQRARDFDNWVKGSFQAEYAKDTGLNNFHVFDLFDILADSTNCLKPEYRINELDSHPKAEGLQEATREFQKFLYSHKILENGWKEDETSSDAKISQTR